MGTRVVAGTGDADNGRPDSRETIMTLLHRATPADLEIRGDGRTVVGIAVPFDTPANIVEAGRSYVEVFRRGAFTKTLTQRGAAKVKVLANHDRQRLPIGRAHDLREDPAGLYAELRVSQTRDGDEVLELVRDGALDGLSIGFSPINHRNGAGGVVERVEVALREISVTAFPAYEQAAIAGVRADGRPLHPPFDREAARRRLDLLALER